MSPLIAKQLIFLAMNEAPAGFEELAKPQRTLIDIYYGNRYLTSQIATFSPQMIHLSDPAAVIRLIGNINDPSLIETTLSGELETHSSQICPPRETKGCGLLETAVAGVIFDESRFRLDVFVNRSFLLTRDAEVRKFLPPSDAGLSLLQNISGAWSGSDATDRDDDYTVSGLTQFAYRENSVYFNWDYTKNRQLQMNDLYGRRNFEGKEYNGGIVSSRGFGLSFTSDRTLLGVRVASSNNTREDTDYTGGTPMDVFLPTRGRVEIRRDDRLISSYFFEAGSQQLNTTSFPSGAYDIEIRILDESGNEISRETRFFAKQYQLPPEGEWQYFAETGQVLDRSSGNTLPTSTEQWLTRAGVSRRLTDTLAGTVAVAATNDDSLVEFGLYNLGYLYELSPSVMLVDNGDYGFNLTTRLRYGSVFTNASYRRLWKDDDTVSTVDKTDRPSLLGNSFEQSNVSVSFPFATGTMSYRFSDSRQDDDDTTRTHAIDYRVSLFRTADYDIDMSLGLSHSGDTDIALMSFEFRLRDDRWTWRATPRVEYQDTAGESDRSENLRLAANWDDRDLFDSTVRADFGAETGSDNERYDARLQVGNSWGLGNLNVNHVRGRTESTTSYSGSFRTSFLTDGNNLAVGGEQQAESALVVNVEGNDGDVFDVKIDGQRRGYAVVGRPSVIPLSPYRQYRVSLNSSASTLYDFDERERAVTLYPGNVVSMGYEAIALKLLFGRLMFEGKPVANVRISGGLYPANSDDIGLFQLESRADTDAITVEMDNGWVCKVAVPTPDSGYVQQMGTIDLAKADCAPVLEGQIAISKNKNRR